MEATNLAELYQTPLLDWGAIERRLDAGVSQVPGTGGPDRHTCWLATINADGSPHVTGVGALWADGCFWFETGQGTRKGRNLARDPRCTLSLATREFDLVVDGVRLHYSDRSEGSSVVLIHGNAVTGDVLDRAMLDDQPADGECADARARHAETIDRKPAQHDQVA